jgi:Tfp pilus assembly protein PilO
MTRRIPLFGALAALLLAIAFYMVLYRPTSAAIAEVRQEVADLESTRSSLQNEVVRLRQLESEQGQLRAALLRLDEFIPDGIAQPELMRQLQEAADAAGVEIKAVAFAQPTVVPEAPPTGEPDTVLASIAVTMTLEGGYFQIVDFFRRIEIDTTRALLLDRASMAEGPDGFPSLTTDWSGSVFTIIPTPADAVPPPAAQGEEAPADMGDGAVPADAGEGTAPADAPLEAAPAVEGAAS